MRYENIQKIDKQTITRIDKILEYNGKKYDIGNSNVKTLEKIKNECSTMLEANEKIRQYINLLVSEIDFCEANNQPIRYKIIKY